MQRAFDRPLHTNVVIRFRKPGTKLRINVARRAYRNEVRVPAVTERLVPDDVRVTDRLA